MEFSRFNEHDIDHGEHISTVLDELARWVLSDDGKIYERLAQLYLDVDKFDDCVTASQNALDKGGVRSTQQVYIVKGMCQFNKDQSVVANLNRARQSFVSCRTEARRDEDESNQRVCQQWITYIDRETQRLEQLEAAI